MNIWVYVQKEYTKIIDIDPRSSPTINTIGIFTDRKLVLNKIKQSMKVIFIIKEKNIVT